MARFLTQRNEAVQAAEVEAEGAVEKVILEVVGVTTDIAARTVFIAAQMYWEAAATAENMTLKIRRGSGVAGTVVGECTTASVASKLNECSLQCNDQPGEVSNQTYTLTATESKAAAKDKVKQSKLRTEC